MNESVPAARARAGTAGIVLMLATLLGSGTATAEFRASTPDYGTAFWRLWGDGRAELSGYELTVPRYGQLRRGVAVTIFVTETFSDSLRVKSDPGKHPKSDEYPVMKLNLVQDFQTGIYDYNLMTSAFTALAPVNGRPAGSPTKVSFSSQEWCGNIYSQMLYDASAARYTVHSYFDGEADQSMQLRVPADAVSEDALLLWARGLAGPPLAVGESREVPMVRSLRSSRLSHQPEQVGRARLSRAAPREVRVPAGAFRAEVWTAAVEGGRTWTFYVEAAAPHRVVQWECTDGERARLLRSARLEYWKMNQEGGEAALAQLGLHRRGAREP